MPASLRSQEGALKCLVAQCGDRELDNVTARLAEGFYAARLQAVSPASANRDLRTLKSVFQRAVERGYLRENPFGRLRPVREAEQEIRVLSTDEIERLLGACPSTFWRALVFILVTTGLRRGEALALQWADVDLDGGLVHIRCTDTHRTKSGRNRVVPLVPAAVGLLRAFRAEGSGPYVFETEGGSVPLRRLREFRKIVKAAGIPACTLHDLRRTYVSSLAMGGVNQAVVQKLAGHASIDTTIRHYTNILPDALRAAPLRLPYAEAANGVSKVYREQNGTAAAQREPVATCVN